MDINEISKPIIFISHVHEDAPLAIGIKNCLEKLFLGGVKFFVSSDGQSIEGGDKWMENIELALRKAKLVIVIATQFSIEKKWIYFESGGAFFLNAKVIPLCTNGITKSSLQLPLSILQSYDYDNDEDIMNLIQQIAKYADLHVPETNAVNFRNCVKKLPQNQIKSQIHSEITPNSEQPSQVDEKKENEVRTPDYKTKSAQLATLGNILSEKGDFQNALTKLHEAIKLDNGNFIAYNNLAHVYSELGRYKEAIEYGTKAISIDSKNPSAFHNRGIYYLRQNKLGEAESDIKKAIELESNFADAYNTLGILLSYREQYNDAIEKITKAIELNPQKAEFYNNRGYVFSQMEEDQKAIEDFDKSLSLKSDNPTTYNLKGVALSNLGQFNDALNCFNKAIQLNQNYANAYLNRGVVLESLGRKDEAFKDYEIAGKLIN